MPPSVATAQPKDTSLPANGVDCRFSNVFCDMSSRGNWCLPS